MIPFGTIFYVQLEASNDHAFCFKDSAGPGLPCFHGDEGIQDQQNEDGQTQLRVSVMLCSFLQTYKMKNINFYY